MRACIFISKSFLTSVIALMILNGGLSYGQEPKKEEKGLFEQSPPHMDYGDFNINEDDDADTLYFQYGRFFGASLGLGYEAATGNRGLLYSPAFPRFDLKVHYWFDFQLAINLGIFFASHTFDFSSSITKVQLIGYGVDLKYYFDVRNASSVLTFSNPFLIGGVGSISKTETSSSSSNPDQDSTFSVNLGAGLEFPISHKKTYFILEGRFHTQNFEDTLETTYQSRGIPDLSGGFFTLIGQILFTW